MTPIRKHQSVQDVIRSTSALWPSVDVANAIGRQLVGAIHAQLKVNDVRVAGRALSTAMAAAVKQGAR